ncbi:MAG: hypothetical protein J7K71_01080 [Candidatus Omnitrophica bacterium]|nr:hypothetical protein [Candidatus Omnitrophota bacterium]
MRIFCFFLILLLLFVPLGAKASLGSKYCVELGRNYLKKGDIYQAEIEFRKALLINPSEEEAKKFLEEIRREKIRKTLDFYSKGKVSPKVVSPPPKESFSPEPSPPKKETKGEWKLEGVYQTGFGITNDSFIWKRANWDLNEEDWRIISSKAYDNRANTFDPAIFTQVRFQLDSPSLDGWKFHTNIDVSPWSFVGKSNKVTIEGIDTGTGLVSDRVEIQLKYWANTGYTVNETYYTLEDGAPLGLPEIKVVRGRTLPMQISGIDWGGDGTPDYTYNLPELDIHRRFWPLRELWFDYNSYNFNFRLFPVALQSQAYTSDDILGLSNHIIWWEESPWLDIWQPGHVDTGTVPLDFFKGYWDDSLTWLARDSQGVRLTNLRGFSFSWNQDSTGWDFTFASPKTLWQDYEEFNTYVSALRGKYFLNDNFWIGGIYTCKLGYNKGSRDATNQAVGVDLTYGVSSNTKVSLELATSKSVKDKTSSYKSDYRGNAVKFSIISSSESDIFDTDYFGINPPKDSEAPFYKLRVELTHMDEGFEAGLSSFRETRDGMFWSRHLHFREPFRYYYAGLYEPTLTWDDIRPFRIGDGIDYGRDVIGLRIEGVNFLKGKCDWLFDIRNIHYTNGKYLETVSRLESTYRATSKLTTKFLGIYHDKPHTVGGIDPFVFDVDADIFYLNSTIEDGEDPSLKTISLGAEYKLSPEIKLYGIWEHTNDSTVAYDNFPRSILRDSSMTSYLEEGTRYRRTSPFLYSQENFPQPPYPYFNIFKAGLSFMVNDKTSIGLDWTHNDYKYAGQIDDNINHIGFELEYLPWEKLSFYFKYVYSKWNDINRLISGEAELCRGHHNFFTELRYRATSNDEFLFQYGVTSRGLIGELIYDPYGGSLAVLDTQHIFRMFYRRKF